jgi:cytidylate kinase
MPIRIITVEREYGSGSAAIAQQLAERLGWKLWDQDLTAEIARVANVEPEKAQRCDMHVDPLVYRLFRVFARGSYERALPLGDSPHFDTDHLVATLQKVVLDVASRGECVIVGRGAPYILRNREDAFHVFVYAPLEEKVQRLQAIGKTEKEAMQLIEEIDRERASFIRHYFGKDWPCRALYHMMINSRFGDEHVIDTILGQVAAHDTRPVHHDASV